MENCETGLSMKSYLGASSLTQDDYSESQNLTELLRKIRYSQKLSWTWNYLLQQSCYWKACLSIWKWKNFHHKICHSVIENNTEYWLSVEKPTSSELKSTSVSVGLLFGFLQGMLRFKKMYIIDGSPWQSSV